MSNRPIAAWEFFAVAGLNVVAAFLPMVKGGRVNAVLLGSAVAFFVVGIVALRRYNASRKPDVPGT